MYKTCPNVISNKWNGSSSLQEQWPCLCACIFFPHIVLLREIVILCMCGRWKLLAKTLAMVCCNFVPSMQRHTQLAMPVVYASALPTQSKHTQLAVQRHTQLQINTNTHSSAETHTTSNAQAMQRHTEPVVHRHTQLAIQSNTQL